MIDLVSKANPLSHYQWGDSCDGWNFVDKAELSIKQERMPARTAEKLHFHSHADQFFFILKGNATFLIENEKIFVKEHTGLTIKAGCKHKITNNEAFDLEFLLISQPSTANDRTNCE